MATLPNGTARHVAALKAAVDAGTVSPKVVAGELGISGTTNWMGDIQSESNTELIHQSAYGTPGARTWGEWETIIRTDPDVAAALDFTAAQLRDARVDVKEAPEESMPDRKLAKAQADFIRWNLLEHLEPGWPEVIQQMTRGSLGYGFSLHEVVLELGAHPSLPNGGTGAVLAKLAERMPVSVDVNGWVEKDGELAAVKQLGQKRDGTFGNVVLPASQVLLVSWNRAGNNYAGFSAFRSVWYICKIRRHLLKLTGIALTREGAGIPTAWASDAKTPLTPKQRRSLQKLLSNNVYHENASVVMPAGWKLDWVFSPGANKGHVIDAWERFGMVILRQLHAQQMTLGSGSTGSRSVGEVHNQVADAFAQGVIANIEGVLNGQGKRPYTGLVRKLIDANWSTPPAAYPRVTLTLKKAKLSPTEKLTAAKLAKDAGMLTPTLDDENAVREDLGLSPIDEETREGGKRAALEMARLMTPAPSKDDEKDEDDDKPPPFGKPAKAMRASQRQPFMPRRPLRASEAVLDLASMDAFLETQREAFERGARPLVLELLAKAIPDIRDAMADGDPSEVQTLKLDSKRLEAFIGKFLERARREGYAQVKAELKRGRPLWAAAADDDKDPPTEEESEVDTLLEAQRKQVTKKMLNRLRSEIEDRAIDVVRTGGDADEVVSEVVQSQLDSSALTRDAGLIVTRAFNMGREEFAREMGDEVEFVELSSILDDGTCAYCEEHDGDEFDFGSPSHDEMTPPLRRCEGGPRCRCLLIYRFK